MAAGGYIEIEKGTTPGAADTDKIRIYPSSVDDLWHEVDEAGTDTVFSGATGATGPTGPAGPGVPPTVTAHGAMGAAETFDYGDGPAHSAEADAACTWTFAGATAGEVIMTIYLDIDASGPYAITLPASVANKTEAEAFLAAVAASTSVIVPFVTIDSGTTWVAMLDEGTITYGVDADITDQDFSDVADAGVLAKVARADHLHGMPASPGGGAVTSAAATASVATDESTASTSYTDLATSGPAVTVTVNTMCLVFVACRVYGAGGEYGRMSFAASSGNTLAADDARCVGDGEGAFDSRGSVPILLTGLTPGSTVFTAKYRAIAGTVNFLSRTIIVIPLD